MTTYKTSNGIRIKKSTIDHRVWYAKKRKLEDQVNELGRNVCSECWKNDCIPIDVAHLVSVDRCQKEGRSELAWNSENLQILGRKCHQKLDKLDLKFGKTNMKQ